MGGIGDAARIRTSFPEHLLRWARYFRVANVQCLMRTLRYDGPLELLSMCLCLYQARTDSNKHMGSQICDDLRCVNCARVHMSLEVDCGAIDWEAAARTPDLWQQTLQVYVVENNMPPHPAVLARAVGG